MGDGRLLVAWMLTPDDGSRDGRFRSYLDKPEKFRHCDPELFDGLLRMTPRQGISQIEHSSLLPRSPFYSRVVPDDQSEREVWSKALLEIAAGHDLVFLDPDTGIEIPSKRIGGKDSSRYVAWNELDGLWEAGCSLLIYQHFPRTHREEFAQLLARELQARTGSSFVEGFYTAYVLFLLVAQDQHMDRLKGALPGLSERWRDQITPMGLASHVE